MRSNLLLRTTWKLAAAMGLMSITTAPAQTAVEAWVQRYSHSNDAVAIDSAGNVIVATHTDAGIDGQDFLVLKYSGAGVALWTNRYGGPGDDFAKGVAVDSNDNVFVTVNSDGAGFSYDFAIVAYLATGTPLWTNRYDGPTNSYDSYDSATAIAVGANGNVFVTGYSDYGFVTVAYSGAGLPLWTNRYGSQASGRPYYHLRDWPSALAVSDSGNVFVTGFSEFGTLVGSRYYDFVTVANSGAGVPLWTNYLDLKTGSWVTAAAVDGNGRVFQTTGGATVACSENGVPLWTNSFPSGHARAIAVDGSGNVFVTGNSFNGTSLDYVTVACSDSGLPLWTNRYNGPGNYNDEAIAVAVDASGNVFVTGSSASTNFFPYNYDYATVAYSGAGMALWTNRYGGPANSDDFPTALAVDGNGNVFVTGNSGGYGTTIKYSVIPAPIPLGYQVIGNQLMLSWTNAAFSLQSSPTVHGTYTNIPGATSPYNTVLSGLQRYFRLTTSD